MTDIDQTGGILNRILEFDFNVRLPWLRYMEVFSEFALDDMAPVSTLDLLSNAQKFCRLRMSVRALAQSRGAFEESNEFGVGEGIGAGAVMGGVCQGGVCVPH